MTRRPIIGRKARARAGFPAGLDGTVRWADPAILASEVSPAGRDSDTATATSERFDVAMGRMMNGDTRPEVLAALDKGREQGRRIAQPKAERLRWELDAVGALPSAPHFLAGCERTMLRPAMHASESAPLRVWVSIGANWSIEEPDLIERGGMLAGIVETLAAVRPVELVAYAHCRDNVKLAWQVDPRDGARLCATFGQSALRGVVMRWIIDKDPRRSTAYDRTEQSARAAFNIPAGDLVVRPFTNKGEGDAEDLRQYLES